ncbi:hypothetical protein ACFVWY_32890 [Streptomyces sp. NPDC058195]|uniref:hypothetical protein n=1 Tax=Streptomyces sp. NPDC058195 TaxID=3346375 RepID=UPI0036F0546B
MAVLHQSAGCPLENLSSLYLESIETIKSTLKNEGVNPDPHAIPAPEKIGVAIKQLYALELSIERISWLFGYSYWKTRNTLIGLSVKPRKRGSRLKSEIIEKDLVWMRKSGMSYEAIARKVGVSRETVRTRLADAHFAQQAKSLVLIPAKTPLPGSAVALLRRQGYTSTQITVLTGRSHSFVERHTALAGLPARALPDPLESDIPNIVDVYRITASAKTASNIFHISQSAIYPRLLEAGQNILSAPDPDATPVLIPGDTPLDRAIRNVQEQASHGRSVGEISAALRLTVANVVSILRIYRNANRREAEVLFRHSQGEHPGVISVRMGIRLDLVQEIIARRIRPGAS